MKEHPVNLSKNHILGWYIDNSIVEEIIYECNRKKILFEKEPSGWRGYSYTYLDVLSAKLFSDYKVILEKCLLLYKDRYTFLHECPDIRFQYKENTNIPNFKIQKYQPNKYYSHLHCENDGKYPYRVLAFMTYLTDLDGGGTGFPQQDFESKSEKGLTLIWPAGFTHPHIGIPATDGIKIIITGWLQWDTEKL